MATANLPRRATIVRIMKEIQQIKQSNQLKKHGIELIVTTHLRQMSAMIAGPPDSPYEGRSFKIDIKMVQKYPFVPPQVKFETTIWHPNIGSRDGVVCVDVLKEKWTPSVSLEALLLMVQNLLYNPDCESPQDLSVGMQMRGSLEEFQRTARVWTKMYGIGTGGNGDAVFEGKLKSVMDVIDGSAWEGEVLRFLSENHWDSAAAVNYFCPDSS